MSEAEAESEDTTTSDLLLPPRTRLLHIGIPKTGTTSLQNAAADNRRLLREHGVRYPGKSMNHRAAVSGLLGRRWGWSGKGSSVPPRDAWEELLREVDADAERRIFISHEFGSEATDEQAVQFVRELGERTHVVVTLRAVGAILPSAWQQYIKTGYAGTFDEWLHAVIGEKPNPKITSSYHLRNDQGGVVKRWVEAAGPENVTVVILDKRRPALLSDAFEGMLGLPTGMLVAEDTTGFAANRGMSLPEAELLRQFNASIRGRRVDWNHYHPLIRLGAVARILDERTPGPDEPKIMLPPWAVDRAVELGQRYAADIRESGARVVGDLSLLSVAAPARPVELSDTLGTVPSDIAVDALGGLFSMATGRSHDFREADEAPKVTGNAAIDRTATMPTGTVPTADLVRVLGARVARKFSDVRRDRKRRADASAKAREPGTSAGAAASTTDASTSTPGGEQ
ncbi:hypothetical protein [Humibacter albus]|uniref:hypothetical protein n=1 Tax=Humibacter albus TaxID=427754 RepID=UPI0003B4CDED|nr:hypothetical protein [Humibacter albus]